MSIQRRILTGLLLAFMATSVWAQSWPTRPVRMIIAFPPGGPTDLVSRVLAQRLSEQLGQQVIVDNKPGAGGNLAAELAARATPDGYTIFYNTSAIVIGPALYGKVNYDTLKDFAPVALTASVPMVLVVNPQLPARSVKEFLDLAKSRPGELNYGTFGAGSVNHLTTVMLQNAAGIKLGNNVSFRGSADSNIQVMSGELPMMFDSLTSVLPHIKSGKLVPLALTEKNRSPLLPEVPTAGEQGVRGVEVNAWYGVFAPTGTPDAVRLKINADINELLKLPDVREKLAAAGLDVLGGSSQVLGDFMKADRQRYGQLAKELNIKAD